MDAGIWQSITNCGTWISSRATAAISTDKSIAGIDLLWIKLYGLYILSSIVSRTPSRATPGELQTQNNQFRHWSVMDIAVWLVHCTMYSVQYQHQNSSCMTNIQIQAPPKSFPPVISIFTPEAKPAFHNTRSHPKLSSSGDIHRRLGALLCYFSLVSGLWNPNDNSR